MRQIIVAFERQSNCERFREVLESTGEFTCLLCRSAAQVKRTVGKLGLNLVVCGFKLADENCETLYFDLPRRCAMLMIAPQAQLELCTAEEVMKLSAPARRAELLASVRLLVRMDRSLEGPAQRSAAERELVEQAKTALMANDGMTEEQAHRFLQKQSMDCCVRLADTARRVLEKIQPGKDA